jgi:acyl dehydratase
MRYYEDLVPGEVEESGTRQVMREELIAFARQYDPQYFHAAPEAAKRSRFGDIIASGIQTMAIWRQLAQEIASDVAWICGVAWDDVRFAKAARRHAAGACRVRFEIALSDHAAQPRARVQHVQPPHPLQAAG